MKRLEFCLLFLVTLLAAILHLGPLLYGNFWFTFDNARDSLWVRDIVSLKKLYLIGPWSSLGGVFFGPGWYYFLTPGFILTQGHPVAGVISIVLVIFSTAFLGYVFSKRYFGDMVLAFLLLSFILFSTLHLQFSRVAFHANVLPLLTMGVIVALAYTDKKFLFGIGTALLLSSLSFHFEPMYGFGLTLGLIIYLLLFQRNRLKNKTQMFILLLIFFIPFIPQIIFELRHDFLQAKAIILYLQGKNQTLSGYLPFLERVVNRFNLLLVTWKRTFGDDWGFAGALLGLTIICSLLKTRQLQGQIRQQNLLKILISIIVGIYLLLTFYSYEAKAWYVAGVPVIYCFFLALVYDWLYRLFPAYKFFFLGLIILTLIFMAKPGSSWEKISKRIRINESAIFANEQDIIDYVYQDASNFGFAVYTYTPGVYDYPYQYLFWWQGARKYKYLPYDMSYLPNKPPEYVPNKAIYESSFLRPKSNTLYLIVEREPEYLERLVSWFNTFESWTIPIKRTVFATGLFVEKRITRQ